MPIGPFPDFDACVAHMTKPKSEGGGGYDEATSRKICGKMKAELEESFGWAGDVRSYPGARLIRGEAIHPVKTYHPLEWPQLRVFLEDELEKSAETLVGKPLFLDHWRPLNGKVLGARYEDGALEYVAELNDDDIIQMIRDGTIKHASIQFEWKILENVDGVAPRGISHQHLSLLKDMPPGDPQTTVEIWESIARQLKEAKGPPADLNPKLEKEKTKLSELKEVEWDQEYVNSLDDNCFAYIEPGGEKDDQGKTTPRSLRHFPYKNAQGNLSSDHVRNGLARLGQELGDWATVNAKAQIKKRLCAAAKELEIESEICGLEEQAGEEPREEPEKDEHGCIIGKQRWDEESQTCVPISPAELEEQQGDDYQAFMEQCMAAGKTMDQCAAEWKEQHPEETPSEAQKTIEALKGQIKILEDQNRALKEELERAKKTGEAIIEPTIPETPAIVVPVEKLEGVLPSLQAERSMSWGAQRFVQEVKHLIHEARRAEKSG